MVHVCVFVCMCVFFYVCVLCVQTFDIACAGYVRAQLPYQYVGAYVHVVCTCFLSFVCLRGSSDGVRVRGDKQSTRLVNRAISHFQIKDFFAIGFHSAQPRSHDHSSFA